VPNIARGNPGLQDLVGLRLVFSDQVPIDRATQVLDDMERWLAGGDLPDEAKVREFLKDLAIDTLLEQAGPAGRKLLQAISLFRLPVPTPAAIAIANAVGGSVEGLRNLRLVDVLDYLVNPQEEAIAVKALAAARLPQLSEDEQATVAAVAVRPLFDTWGAFRALVEDVEVSDLQMQQCPLLGGSAVCSGPPAVPPGAVAGRMR
jgi:hypothetical protein